MAGTHSTVRTARRLLPDPSPVAPGSCARKTETRTNDRTIREAIWRRFQGDDWAAFDQLPQPIRQRLAEHAYDAWSVNALILWRHYRRLHPTAERAVRGLLRYLDYCERLERRAFAADHVRRHGTALPHEAAGIPVLRYAAGQQPGPPP